MVSIWVTETRDICKAVNETDPKMFALEKSLSDIMIHEDCKIHE